MQRLKNLLTALITILCFCPTALAEKIPVKIEPAQVISTTHDETEIGDYVKFSVISDVYKNDKVYIAKGTQVLGLVDYVQENGWSFDNAQIDFRIFKTRDVKNNLVIINSFVSINGFETLKYKGNRPAQFFNYIGVIFRGKEVDLNPDVDKMPFTIWLQ